MAEDDIYNNKRVYERSVENLWQYALPPEQRRIPYATNSRFYCRNKENLKYFYRLVEILEARDSSFARRKNLLGVLRFVCDSTTKPLADCNRDDIDAMVARVHGSNRSAVSVQNMIRNIKYIWKSLLPEKDALGRPDETAMPYVVKHLRSKVDRSRKKERKDRLTWEEFRRIIIHFSDDPKMQAFLTLKFESLRRPQELLYTRVGDYEFHDAYAVGHIREHGKEGPGIVRCIDSYPYLSRWLNSHPYRDDPNAFMFISYRLRKDSRSLMMPESINWRLRRACQSLGIDKPITCYSFKRNGVSVGLLCGDSGPDIQKKAGWTSLAMLKHYDLSTQKDAFQADLVRRGLAEPGKGSLAGYDISVKECGFCGTRNGFADESCSNCVRPLDREKLKRISEGKAVEAQSLREELASVREEVKARSSHDDALARLLSRRDVQAKLREVLAEATR